MPLPPPPPLGRFTSAGPPTSPGEARVLVVESEAFSREDEPVVEIVPLVDEDVPLLDELVQQARHERELERLAAQARYAVINVELEPMPWHGRLWPRVGAAALVGYALGRSRLARVLAVVAFGASLVSSIDRALAHVGPTATPA